MRPQSHLQVIAQPIAHPGILLVHICVSAQPDVHATALCVASTPLPPSITRAPFDANCLQPLAMRFNATDHACNCIG
eukprot:5464451-Pyramimonas_sp.AAC.1